MRLKNFVVLGLPLIGVVGAVISYLALAAVFTCPAIALCVGTPAADQITLVAANTTVNALGGNDTILANVAEAAAVTINGGAGNDAIFDALTGGKASVNNGDAGNDTISIAAASTSTGAVNGGAGNDTVQNASAVLRGAISGNDGNDRLAAVTGKATQVYNGDAGNDTLTVAGSAVAGQVFNGGDGNDIIDASANAAAQTLNGNAGNDRILDGLVADAAVTGGDGNDQLFLQGDNLTEVLIDAGPGADVLTFTGGAAAGTGVGAQPAGSLFCGPGVDTVIFRGPFTTDGTFTFPVINNTVVRLVTDSDGVGVIVVPPDCEKILQFPS